MRICGTKSCKKKPKKTQKRKYRQKPQQKHTKTTTKTHKNTNRKSPFQRLVREVIFRHKRDVRIQRSAIMLMQEACEAYMISWMEDALLLAIHAKRITIFPKDYDLLKKLRKRTSLA